MKKLLTVILLVATVLVTVATLGFASSDSATVTVGWTINPQQSLQIKSNSTTGTSNSVESIFHIPAPSDTDLENGRIIEENAIRLVATSNIDWAVQVKAKSPSLGTGKGGYRKPVSDLSVRGQGRFKQVSTGPVTIASGEPGRHEFGVDYKVQYDENYKSGNYVAELIYTVSPA